MQQIKNTSKNNNLPISIEFTPKNLTSWGGISSLVSHYLLKLNFREWVNESIPIEDTSNNSVLKYSKVLSLFLTVLSGGRRFSHSALWWHGEEVFRESFNVERFTKAPSSDTRFWNKVNSFKLSEAVLKRARKLALKIACDDGIVEDDLRFDSSVITRYGNQEGAVKGYNPAKRGRNSHNPMIGFLGSGYVINIWNRKGNASSGNGIVEYFKQTVDILGDDIKVLKVICDSGFYLIRFIEHLENKSFSYIISAPICQLLQKKILEQKNWTQVVDGIDIAEFRFRHLDKKWKKERRYISVRQEVNQRPKATGKFMSLLFDLPEITNYRYSVMITNDELSSPKEVWDRYKPRAKDENVIKELKDSYGLNSFNLKSFWATEAVMAMIALVFYNLILYMKKHVINKSKNVKEKLSTIRIKHFIIPAMIGKNSRKAVLRMGIKDSKKQNLITEMLKNIENLNFSLKCNAVEN